MFSEAPFFAVYCETHILLSSVIYQIPTVSANSGKNVSLSCFLIGYTNQSHRFWDGVVSFLLSR